MVARARTGANLYVLDMRTKSPWTDPINAWIVAMRAAGRPETTIRTRSEHLRWLARWAGARDPWDLTTDDLTAWMGSKAWARETRRGVRSSLRGFYRWATTTGRTTHDPAAALPSIPPAQPRPRPTPDRAYRLAIMAADVRERLMLRLAAECGLRRAEVAQVHSRDLVEDLGGWSLVVHGKGARERVVPLPASLARELRMLGHGYAFPGDDHGHLSPRWVGKLVTRLLPEGYTMHSLRHRFATKAYAVDRDVFTVQELLGHASPTTTRVYVQLPDDSKRRLVEAISA